jgi:hypothetical protein
MIMQNIECLAQPLTKAEMLMQTFKNGIPDCLDVPLGYVGGIVSVPLDSIIDGDSTRFINDISERLTGDKFGLDDITYSVMGVGINDSEVMIGLYGNPESILDELPYNLQYGDEVTWNDPDEGTCTRTGIISEIVWLDEETIDLTFQDGWTSQVRPEELS